MRLSLRTRLLGSFLIVIVVYGTISTIVGIHMIGTGIVNQAQDKVRLDLNSAREIYQESINSIRDAVRHTAIRFFIREDLSAGNLAGLAEELQKIRLAESLDILTLTDRRGKVLLRTHNPSVRGDNEANNEMVKQVIAKKRVVASTEIISREELLKEGEDLARQAHIPLISTPKSKPTSKTEETSGMMLKAAAPIIGNDGRLLGVLYGGKLLNRNYEVVDKIKETVYQGEVFNNKEIGTATIFQGDLRISTNVKTKDGKRAIGTRVSEEVHDRVLVNGKPWVERAFVVNDWYITAYEPIRDISGNIVGMLYVGMLEQKFENVKRSAFWTFIGISFIGITLAIIICYFLSRILIKPFNGLVSASQDLAAGNLKKRVEENDSIKEIYTLSKTFNFMASSIEERDERLKRRAQEQIMKSERLAMIGQLAAGVAHELNNPLGGILLFSRLLLRNAPEEGVERENLERISKEADRCQRIVRGLLAFARQSEPKAIAADINEIINKTIALIEHQLKFQNIRIVKRLENNLPKVSVDESQIQQVFVNLIMNAAEAMDAAGVLTITTKSSGGQVEISFADTGHGIKQEDLKHLFEPFFTTKEVGQGTGLGLSISQGIVERHGGTLTVTTKSGVGTTFVISLPASGEKP